MARHVILRIQASIGLVTTKTSMETDKVCSQSELITSYKVLNRLVLSTLCDILIKYFTTIKVPTFRFKISTSGSLIIAINGC